MKWPEEIIKEGNEILEKIDFSISTPNKSDVLNFLTMGPSKIKVVIIGQDPYPTKGVANGFAFAVNNNCKIPMSLRNIFKEIKEIHGKVNTDRTLKSWVNQGVLLLNASLTTEIQNPNAHKDIWFKYTQKVLSYIDNNIPDVVWVLWGQFALKVAKNINGKKIIDAHPSPLSVRHRNKETFKKLSQIKW